MKVAVISDIHGNMRALEAALEDIRGQKVDQIICAGDVPNPFLRSLDAWLLLKSLGIPVIRGNHEDYIVSYFSGDRPEIRDAVQFLPIQVVAKHVGAELAREFAALPFDHTISGPGGDDLYICHASPQHNSRSYLKGVDAQMAQSFARVSAKTVAAGHIHTQWSSRWQDKNLVICGSVGLPHHGKPEAEYAIFTHARGEWRWELRTAPYDVEGALQEYAESGALEQGGPLAWLLYDEIWCAAARLVFFLPTMFSSGNESARAINPNLTLEEWSRGAETFLRKIGRWDALKKRCPTTL